MTILSNTGTVFRFFLSRTRRRVLSPILVIRINRTVCFSATSVARWNPPNNVIMSGSQDIHEYLEVAKKLALEAGEVFKCAISLEKKVEYKRDLADLLTEYDNKIEDMLIKGLSKRYPDHKFVAEESVPTSGELPELTDSPTWVIDPIDGTTNFVHGLPLCCISMGLTVHKRLELGLIYNPINDEMYTAIRGEGAFLNGKRIRASKTTELNKTLIYIEPMMLQRAGKNRDIILARIEAIIGTVQGVRSLGSAALALAYIASGVIDAMQMDGLSPWDIAAGQLIIEEAGGVVIDTKGGPHNLMKPKTIAACTEDLGKVISKLIVDTDLQAQRKRLKRVPSSSKLI